jgi:hypothetical protein
MSSMRDFKIEDAYNSRKISSQSRNLETLYERYTEHLVNPITWSWCQAERSTTKSNLFV